MKPTWLQAEWDSLPRFRWVIVLATVAVTALAYAQFRAPHYDTVCNNLLYGGYAICRAKRTIFWAEIVAIACGARAVWLLLKDKA